MNFIRYVAITTLLFIIFNSCSQKISHTQNRDYQDSIIIVNTLSEDLSVLKNNKVINHLAPTDTGANRIIQDGKDLIVINSLSNSLTIYNSSLKLLYETSTGTGTNPFAGVIFHKKLFITAYLTDEILEMGKENGKWALLKKTKIRGELPKDSGIQKRKFAPMGICKGGDKIFVALANLNTNSVAAGPGGVYIGNGNEWNIMEVSGRDTVNVVNLGKTIAIISAGDYVTGKGFIGNGKIELYNFNQLEITKEINIPGAPYTVTGPISGHYFVSDAMKGEIFILNENWKIEKTLIITSGSLSMISDLVIYGNSVVGLEFNSNSLFLVDPESQTLKLKLKTGDGPISLINFKGGD